MSDVADAYETDRSTIFGWVNRFQEEGEEGLVRRPTSGRPRKLQDLTEEELRNIVLQPASDFGYETDLWTAGRLHTVIEDQYRVRVSKDTIWRRLREAGLTYQKPEREYYELDEETRQDWLRKEVPKIRNTVEKYRAILYFQDGANVSLTAFLGKMWSPCGQTPKAKVTGKRGGVAAMSAISRRGHLLFRLHNKRIASPEATTRLLSSQVLARLEPRRESLESSQTPRTHKTSSQDDRRTENTNSKKAPKHGKTTMSHARHLLPVLCCRTFRMSHMQHARRSEYCQDTRRPERNVSASRQLGTEEGGQVSRIPAPVPTRQPAAPASSAVDCQSKPGRGNFTYAQSYELGRHAGIFGQDKQPAAGAAERNHSAERTHIPRDSRVERVLAGILPDG